MTLQSTESERASQTAGQGFLRGPETAGVTEPSRLSPQDLGESKPLPASTTCRTSSTSTESDRPNSRIPLALIPDPGYRRVLSDVPRCRSLVPESLLSAFADCAEGRQPWPLFVSGPAGIGKTLGALYFADRVVGLRDVRPGTYSPMAQVYMDFSHLCENIRRAKMGTLERQGEGGTFPQGPDDEWGMWERALLTILDDVGTRGTSSDHVTECFRQALDLRFCKPSIVISNLPPSDLARVFDDRVASRALAGTVVCLEGRDQRLQGYSDESSYLSVP